MMEFWLSFNNRAEVFQLPVPPPSFNISKGTIVQTINVNSVGEIAVIGKSQLATIQIDSFFPKQQYSFCQYKSFPEPYECANMIEKWKNSGRPIRLMITNTNVNLACCIENFSYGEKDGSGDVYFTLSLKEYRFLSSGTAGRPNEYVPPSTYTVRSEDTLVTVAKKLYGDSSLYTKFLQKNSIQDIKEGQVIVA
jgi:nucleoid-associated protein YgaU